MSISVAEKRALRQALAEVKPRWDSLGADLWRGANKGLKRGWSPDVVWRILAEVNKLVETADDICEGVSVPDSPLAKKDEQQRRKAAKKAKPGRKSMPHDTPWDAVAEKQVAKEGRANAAFAKLATLPPRLGVMVRGRAVRGKKLQELAVENGISEDQASRRYIAGIERLRKQTGADGGGAILAEPSIGGALTAEECSDSGLIIVNRPGNSWISSRHLDANPEHEFSKPPKSTKLN